MKVLILGHTGMLGHMIFKYLKNKKAIIDTTNLRWPSDELKIYIKNYDGDYIINCIGSIPQRTNIFDVNWELPIFLDFYSKCKIIHPGTDGDNDRNPYGFSKKIARDFVLNTSGKTKSIKTCIIGPELGTKSSLMEWFLSNQDNESVFGYTEHFWNGATTLTWSEYAYDLMTNWEKYDKEIILHSKCISKKELLETLNKVFLRKIIIEAKNETKLDRCLIGGIEIPDLETQLDALKSFYYEIDVNKKIK
jgi:dTDP-4-dehydrorhamnose reductase